MTMEAHASGRSGLAKANGATRCGAKTRTAGQPCKPPCRQRIWRCRLHGGRSTGPKSAAAVEALKAKMTNHGWFSQEAIAAHKEHRALLRAVKAAAKKDNQTMSGAAAFTLCLMRVPAPFSVLIIINALTKRDRRVHARDTWQRTYLENLRYLAPQGLIYA